MRRLFCILIVTVLAISCGKSPSADDPGGDNPVTHEITVTISQRVVPVLAGASDTPVARIDISGNTHGSDKSVGRLTLAVEAGERMDDIRNISLWSSNTEGNAGAKLVEKSEFAGGLAVFDLAGSNLTGDFSLWVCMSLVDNVTLGGNVGLSVKSIDAAADDISFSYNGECTVRKAIALRKSWQDNVHTSRIPGLVTTKNGTLLAIFDARYASHLDIQGDVDIALHRSTDGGHTWEPMKVIMDMGKWGGLPERFNGLSDACIVCDDNTGEVFVFASWMHGIIDPQTKEWIEGITEQTDLNSIWQASWHRYVSLPGLEPQQTHQFMAVSSTDDGRTWSAMKNLTRMVKPETYHKFSPCPGRGITMSDGTIVVPISGRDVYTDTFAGIIYSKDHGDTWVFPRMGYSMGGEGTVTELSDGTLMLSTHLRSNAGLTQEQGNGRGVVTTQNLGQNWQLHPTDHTLIEPPCQASLHMHHYTENGAAKSVLLFFNPRSDILSRVNMTLQASLDDGATWPENHRMLIDIGPGSGYSCLTSIDKHTVGLLYESSNAQLSFMQIKLEDILKRKINP